jgi:hypothetical protein
MTRVEVNFGDMQVNGQVTGLIENASGKVKRGATVELYDAAGNTANGLVLRLERGGVVYFDVTNFRRHD